MPAWNPSAVISSSSSAGGSTPGGAAGGDLGGTYPNPSVITVGGAAPALLEGSVTSYSASHSIAINEGLLEFTGSSAATFTLPAPTVTTGLAGSSGRQYAMANVGTALLTVAVAGGALVGDSAVKPGRQSIFVTDGVNWFQIPFSYPLTRVSRASQTVTNSVVLVNDTELVLPLPASKVCIVDFRVFYEAVHGADIQIAWTAPAGATGGWSTSAISGNIGMNPAIGSTNALRAFGTAVSFGGGGVAAINELTGTIYVSTSSAGNLTLQFAQATAGANNTIRYAGSILSLVETT